ncbi:MAG: hypothetical protein M3437_19725 [Chloroflexota bacterium]|nr:hypothetical protein [Chloroflexota bacterium]MDQ5864661.1 hypothetical protein [Chloroflexota bacterium]
MLTRMRFNLIPGCFVLLLMLAGCGNNTATVPATNTPTAASPTVVASPTTEPTEEPQPTTPVETVAPTFPELPATLVPASPTAEPVSEPAPTFEPLPNEGQPSMSPADAEAALAGRESEAIEALKNKDMQKLSDLVHPDKGVGFAPYQYIDETNLTLTREELAGALTDDTVRHWGAFDGTGDPMDMTFAEYYDRFIYNHDFSTAPNISYNQFKGHGNSINNMFVVYPQAIGVEYHFPGFDPQYEGMDWNALYLVFEKHTDGNWYLVHITHGQWTI